MRAGVAAGAVNTVQEALAQAHTLHRKMIIEREGYKGLGIPVWLSETMPSAGVTPPTLDSHGEQIRKSIHEKHSGSG